MLWPFRFFLIATSLFRTFLLAFASPRLAAHLIYRLLSHFRFLLFFFRLSGVFIDELREGTAPLHQLFVGPLGIDSSVLHDHDEVDLRQKADAVRGQDSGPVFQQASLGAENPLVCIE